MQILMAILATWRLVEIVTIDEISKSFRQKHKHYFWTCGKCVSVWAGGLCFLIYFFAPFLNWPLGLSMLAILGNQIVNAWTRRQAWDSRTIVIHPDMQQIEWGRFDREFAIETMKSVIATHQQRERAVHK
jgi:hypothetical protein